MPSVGYIAGGAFLRAVRIAGDREGGKAVRNTDDCQRKRYGLWRGSVMGSLCADTASGMSGGSCSGGTDLPGSRIPSGRNYAAVSDRDGTTFSGRRIPAGGLSAEDPAAAGAGDAFSGSDGRGADGTDKGMVPGCSRKAAGIAACVFPADRVV